jgi:hypothetical protein
MVNAEEGKNGKEFFGRKWFRPFVAFRRHERNFLAES